MEGSPRRFPKALIVLSSFETQPQNLKKNQLRGTQVPIRSPENGSSAGEGPQKPDFSSYFPADLLPLSEEKIEIYLGHMAVKGVFVINFVLAHRQRLLEPSSAFALCCGMPIPSLMPSIGCPQRPLGHRGYRSLRKAFYWPHASLFRARVSPVPRELFSVSPGPHGLAVCHHRPPTVKQELTDFSLKSCDTRLGTSGIVGLSYRPNNKNVCHLKHVLEGFDVAHELLQRVLLLVEYEIVG